MSRQVIVVVRCDGEGCIESWPMAAADSWEDACIKVIEGTTTNMRTLRNQARRAGWRCSPGRDFCPECAPNYIVDDQWPRR